MIRIAKLVVCAALLLSSFPALAQDLGIPAQISQLQAAVAALQQQNAALTAQVNALNKNSVTALNGVLALNGTTVTFTGVNVQIVDGSGQTASTSGLGNLIVGYNNDVTTWLPPPSGYTAAARTGSHNLILGDGN